MGTELAVQPSPSPLRTHCCPEAVARLGRACGRSSSPRCWAGPHMGTGCPLLEGGITNPIVFICSLLRAPGHRGPKMRGPWLSIWHPPFPLNWERSQGTEGRTEVPRVCFSSCSWTLRAGAWPHQESRPRHGNPQGTAHTQKASGPHFSGMLSLSFSLLLCFVFKTKTCITV